MLPPTCVVVPTYWTRAGGEARPGDAIYDHPTPLDAPDTLTALVESLNGLDASFYLLLLIAVTGEDVSDAAEERVKAIIERCPRVPCLLFGRRHLVSVYRHLESSGIADPARYLDLLGYPTIRNLQLAVPLALGSTAIVALDDDEIVTDPDFMRKAVEPLGTSIAGRRVDGLSGHYLQADGSILLRVDPAKAASPNLFDRKAAIMNQAAETLEALPGDTVETPFCFGGNMEFTPDLAAAVGFDPEITRGEDIDYLINARMEGRHFFLRKDLRILHCPPAGGSYRDLNIRKTQQDVIRFVYEQEKLRVSQSDPRLCPVRAEDLGEYPGLFLDHDITEDAIGALQQAGMGDEARSFVEKVHADAAEKMQRYLTFREQWPAVTEAMAGDATLRAELLSAVRGV